MADAPDPDPDLEALLAPFVARGDWAGAEAALDRYDPAALGPAARELWYRYRGVVAFRRGDRAAALARFEAGLAACPDSAAMRFSLAQELEAAGRSAEALAHFAAARFPALPAPHALAGARFAYLWGETAAAWEATQPVWEATVEAGAFRDEAAAAAGLPPFRQTWGYRLAFAEELGRVPGLAADLAACRGGMDEAVREEYAGFLACLETGDFGPWRARLAPRLAEWEAAGRPAALARFQVVVSGVRAEADPLEASRRLAALRVDDAAEPWLEDARLLATCELLERAGMPEAVPALREEFLARQPFLLEPHAAAYAGLVAYQRRWKDAYRARRGAAAALQ